MATTHAMTSSTRPATAARRSLVSHDGEARLGVCREKCVNRSGEFWAIICVGVTLLVASMAHLVILWNVWSGVADNTQGIADVRVAIAELETAMIRETFTNRERISTLERRVNALEDSAP